MTKAKVAERITELRARMQKSDRLFKKLAGKPPFRANDNWDREIGA